MVGRRIGYALLTLLAWGVFIWTENSIALFVGVFLLALPVVTFVMLVIAGRNVKFDCEVGETCMRGSALKVQMKVGVTPTFFVGSVEVTVVIKNTTFGRTEKQTFVFYDLDFTPITYNYLDENSGRIHMEVVNIKLLGFLGVSAYSVKRRMEFESIVSPVLYDNLQLSVGLGSGFASLGEKVDATRKGFDHSEIFAVREYVPGDSLNSVHWKLSGKFDELKTKDFASAGDYKVLLLTDLSRNKRGASATDLALNKILDLTISLSNFLWEVGIFHCVGWVDDGMLHYVPVNDYESFLVMVHSLMSAKVTEEDVHAAAYMMDDSEGSSFTKYVFLSSGATLEEVQEIVGEVTAIAVGERMEEVNTENIRMIEIKPEYVETALLNGLL